MNSIHNKFPFKIDTHESYYDVPIKCYLPNYNDAIEDKSVCLKDIHIDNVRIFGQGVRKFVQLNLYTAL